MKVVILAGGFGTRINEISKPKPLIEIGNMPILWHIMKIYSSYQINDFIICSGYKANIIEDYFLNSLKSENVEKQKDNTKMTIVQESTEPWNVTLVDTGLKTMTGGRLKRVAKYLEKETFCFTYGDTLNNVNIKNLVEFHKKKKLLGTVTACRPPEKYGVLIIDKDTVSEFKEKPVREDWVNGGFFVLEPEVLDFVNNDSTVWEKEPMNRLVKDKQLGAYRHTGFYQHMDTISEKNYLNKLWESKNPPWRVWK